MEELKNLEASPLFNALLKGYEIRFSDMIKYVSDEWNYIPFLEGNYVDIKVDREKSNTDIWCEGKLEGESISLPFLIIENKLKSLPYESQLRGYSEKFLLTYLNKFKETLRTKSTETRKETIHDTRIFENNDELIEKIASLNFFILSPLGDEEFNIDIRHPLKLKLEKDIANLRKKFQKNNQKDKEKIIKTINNKQNLLGKIDAHSPTVPVTWQPKSYDDLGNDIEDKIVTSFHKKKSYEKKEKYRLYKEGFVSFP